MNFLQLLMPKQGFIMKLLINFRVSSSWLSSVHAKPITWGGLPRFAGISARLLNTLKINFAVSWKNLSPDAGSRHRDAGIPVGSGWVVLKHKNKTKTKQKQKTLMFYICKFFKQDTYLLLLTKIIKITESKSGVLWYQKYQDWVLRCTLVTRLITFPVPVYALEELLKSCANFPPKDTGLLLGAFLVLQKVFSSQRT